MHTDTHPDIRVEAHIHLNVSRQDSVWVRAHNADRDTQTSKHTEPPLYNT